LRPKPICHPGPHRLSRCGSVAYPWALRAVSPSPGGLHRSEPIGTKFTPTRYFRRPHGVDAPLTCGDPR
jgi:hypothetical protein